MGIKQHRIIISDALIKQEGTLVKEIKNHLYKNYEKLYECSQNNRANEYLNSQNSKKMQGAENIWKYRLTNGARILYSFGRYCHNAENVYDDDIILIHVSEDHDAQGKDARIINLGSIGKTETLDEHISVAEEEYVLTRDEEEARNNFWNQDYFLRNSFSVINGEDFASISLDELDKLLSYEQQNIIEEYFNNPYPSLMLGGAGSGKTLVGIHLINAFLDNNPDKKAVYVTQSSALINHVRRIYKGISTARELPCMNINEFCMDKLQYNPVNFIDTSRFISLFWNCKLDSGLRERCEKNNIDSLNAWTEIRGVIKGKLDKYWRRSKNQNQDKYGNIQELLEHNYIEMVNDKDPYSKRVILKGSGLFRKIDDYTENLRKKADSDSTLSVDSKKKLDAILSYYDNVDTSVKSLTKEEYCNVGDAESTLEADKRKLIWMVYEKYEHFLEEGYYDDNDLARETLDKITPDDVYNFMFVDEVQDYTELQLYLLNCLCTKGTNGANIFYAGDSHQNVNPTLFSVERLKALYHRGKSTDELRIKYLKKNYRCTNEIIKVSNAISRFRRERIGMTDQISETEADFISEGKPVTRLAYSEENIRLLLRDLNKYPGVAVLVPDSGVKKDLAGIMKDTGFNDVYSVSEIKGMEYQCVVCFNIFSHDWLVWSRLTRPENVSEFKRKTKYRYYFNLAYVAATRARINLCFIDNKVISEIDNKLALTKIEKYSFEELYLTELSNKETDYYKSAKEYENHGYYEKAIDNYNKSGEFRKSEDILRCLELLAEQNNDYRESVKLCIACKNSDRGEYLVKNVHGDDDESLIVRAFYDIELLKKINSSYNFSQSIRKLYEAIPDADIDYIEKQYSIKIAEACNTVADNMLSNLKTK